MGNTTILNKCIEELKQDKPKIDYILGMLETVVAMSSVVPTSLPFAQTTGSNVGGTPLRTVSQVNDIAELTDEERFAEAYIHGPVAPLS